jgi:hypothetical protein
MSKKKPFMGRDYLLLKIIGGATKAGVEPDRKKEANKTAARGNKMNRADRQKPQENGMMVAELKHLRAQVKAKDEKIAKLTEEVQELRAQVNLTAMLDPTTEENKALAEEARKWAVKSGLISTTEEAKK